MKKIVGILLITICGVAVTNAQQAISTAGGEASGAGGTASFTAGQPDYIYLASNNGSVMQGIQQPFDVQTVTRAEFVKDVTLVCEAYPNPVNDLLVLKIQRDKLDNLSYSLMDVNGRVLEENIIDKTENAISLKEYSQGTYFLTVIDNNKELKTFKIIKN